jgi:type II secretory pathway pseudopilin PulG
VLSYLRRHHRFEYGGDDRSGGYTLVELMVTTGIFLMVMSALLTTLEVASRQERRTSAIVDNQFIVMNALQVLTREIRAANPIETASVTSSDEMRTSIEVSTGSVADGDRKTWRFAVDATTGSLIQEDVSSGSAAGARVLVPRMLNSPNQPVFRYFDAVEQELTTTGFGAVSPADIANCATKVVIHIISAPPTTVGGPPPYEAVSSTELRNRLPGGAGCQEQ